MTTIIVSSADVAWVDPTTEILRQQGMKVVRLRVLGIVGFLLMSERIAAVLVHEDRIPSDWELVRKRMARIAPDAKVVIVPRRDKRSPAQLASLVMS